MRPLAWVCLLALTAGSPGAQGQGIVVDGKKVLTGGSTCPAGQSLVGFAADGSALCECLSGRTQCTAAACVDLDSDEANCGACDNACSAGVSCVDGRCRGCDVWDRHCPSGQSCYYSFEDDQSLCALVINELDGQGAECDPALYNTCAAGYGCVLPNEAPPTAHTGFVCALFCDAELTRPWDDGDAFCAAQLGAGYGCARALDLLDPSLGEDVAFCAGPDWFVAP